MAVGCRRSPLYALTSFKNGKIRINLKQKDGKNQLSIKDNGVGIGDDIDLSYPKTLGLKLVKILTTQIQGDLHIIKKNGTEFLITF